MFLTGQYKSNAITANLRTINEYKLMMVNIVKKTNADCGVLSDNSLIITLLNII